MLISLYDLLFALSSAMDLISASLFNHHQQVAYMSYRLGQEMGFEPKAVRELLLAGLVHDIGSLSLQERLQMIEEEWEEINGHAFRGAALLEKYPPFLPLADILRYHHFPWNHGENAAYQGKPVPAASHVLHLADRICVKFTRNSHALTQLPDILAYIQEGDGTRFLPQGVEAATRLAAREYIWLELNAREPLRFIKQEIASGDIKLTLEETLKISEIFSHVIDFRSRFTATHSAGVAQTARLLGELSGMSSTECDMLQLAGYLHDMGKIAIDNEILEKPGQLSPGEYKVIRSHTFYTYHLLTQVAGLETVAKWAAYHHESLSGRGYPFHLKEESLPYGSRIMAVADVFTAITEDRPYRSGMPREQGMKVMKSMVENGSLSREIVDILLANYDMFLERRGESQREAQEIYKAFFSLL